MLYTHSKSKLSLSVENWHETIYAMDFDIAFCKGIKNILADDLSRLFVPDWVGDDGQPWKEFIRTLAKHKGEKSENDLVPNY